MNAPEQWRPIAGFPGYFASDQGRIASERRGRRRILKGRQTGTGYLKVSLSRGSREDYSQRKIHHLVAEAFHGPRPEGLEVRHLDGDGLNNSAANVAYGTHSENMRDRVRHGRDPQANRTHCPRDHEYTPATTYINRKTGGRSCIPCRRMASAAYETRRAFRAAGIAA